MNVRKCYWSLIYTPGVLASFAAATGAFVNNHYRKFLKLGNYGKMSSYLPIVAIPAIFSLLSHKIFVQETIIINPMSECPLCLQLRAVAFQTGVGVVYPTILAPFAAFMFATRHYTYRLPSVTETPMEILKLWRKMSRPILPTLGTIFAGQALITMYLTFKEIEQSVQVIGKMKMLEQQYENEHGSLESTSDFKS